MSRSRAIRSGISMLARQPLLLLAELAWRWTFSTAVLALGAYSLLLFLHSRPVTGGDLFGLSGIVPSLFAQTIAHIFQGSGPTILRIGVVLAVGFSFLWWLAASWGRTATLQAMRNTPARGQDKSPWTFAPVCRSIFGLNALRVLSRFAVTIGYVGAFLVTASASGMKAGVQSLDQSAAIKFYFIFLPLAFLIGTIGSTLAWYLSLAPVLAASNDTRISASLRDAALLSRRRGTQFLWVGFICGALQLLLYAAAFFFSLALAGLFAQVPGEIVWGIVAFLALIYSACSTLIAMVRLGAYVRIVQWDGEEGSKTIASDETIEPPPATPVLPSTITWKPPPAPPV